MVMTAEKAKPVMSSFVAVTVMMEQILSLAEGNSTITNFNPEEGDTKTSDCENF